MADQAGACRFGSNPDTSVLQLNRKAHNAVAGAIRVGEHLDEWRR